MEKDYPKLTIDEFVEKYSCTGSAAWKTIFERSYASDLFATVEEREQYARQGEEQIEHLIEIDHFLASREEQQRNFFGKLAIACHTLAQYQNATMAIDIYPAINEANIFIFAPTFIFDPHQLLWMNNICIGASSMAFLPGDENDPDSALMVGFVFSKHDGKILNYLLK